MKKILYLLIISMSSIVAKAQFTIGTGDNILEISGRTSFYYNNRFLKSGESDKKNNRFKLRDAIINIEGRNRNIWEYRLQADIADIAAGTSDDPENPGLMDASITYKGLSFLNIKMGYGKVPYSYLGMVPFSSTPYWQRAQLVRGDIFSRRDVGVTLSSSFWEDKVNLYGGIYTGLGELSLKGDNDASGGLEYISRIEVSYPVSTKYREIDLVHTPIPIFTLGVNGRYANKKLPEGEVFPDGAVGGYGIKVINGEKYTYGLDLGFQYYGFTTQFEIHQVKARPQNDQDQLYQGYTASQANNHIYAGGLVGQINYHFKDLGTTLSTRYEELDLSDLVPGKSKRISAALEQKLKGLDASIRLQYFNIMEEETIDALKWRNQLRIGTVINF